MWTPSCSINKKVSFIQSKLNIILRLDLVLILRQRSITCMNLEWPCLAMEIRRIFYYFKKNTIWHLTHWEFWHWMQKNQYTCTFLRGKELFGFENICVQIVNMTTLHLNQILLVLGTYFSSIKILSKKNSTIRR